MGPCILYKNVQNVNTQGIQWWDSVFNLPPARLHIYMYAGDFDSAQVTFHNVPAHMHVEFWS